MDTVARPLGVCIKISSVLCSWAEINKFAGLEIVLDWSVDKVQSKIGFVRSNPWTTGHFAQSLIMLFWWISIRFVCFVFQGSLLCDHPLLGNNRLVKFASRTFLTFLYLVTCKSKATSASFLGYKILSSSRFPLLFFSSLESFSAKLDKHITLWFA